MPAFLCSTAWTLPFALDAQSRAFDECGWKAAFLFNFARFEAWPKGAVPDEHSSIRVGLAGKDPYGRTLERVVTGKSISGDDLQIVFTRPLGEVKICQIVFVSASKERRLLEIILGLRESSGLKVRESEDFAWGGGAIQFRVDDEKIRFTIHVDAAERARQKFSSKLLSLGKGIRDGKEPMKS